VGNGWWSVELNAFRKPGRCRRMLKDHRPTRAPRLTIRQHRAPLIASCKALDLPPNELAIWRSGGCRMIRAGRDAEIAPERSASLPTREVLRKPAGQPVSTGGIRWRQRPRTEGLQRIRSSRPARSIRHHPMLGAFYWLEIPDWYYAIVTFWPVLSHLRNQLAVCMPA